MTVEIVHANHSLLTSINDMMGKDVIITVSDGRRYTGILVACSPAHYQQMAFGLRLAYEITENNAKNLLARASETVEKMHFDFEHIVGVSACITEEKPGTRSMGFATDRDYHGSKSNGDHDDGGFEEWNGDEDEEIENTNTHVAPRVGGLANGGGWTANEMFAANKAHGVVSTFKDDLTQYTTAAVEGTEEDRRRADQLAREIEQNSSSRFNARLENDDDERDLDKQTTEDDFELVGGNGRRGNRGNSYGQQQRSGRMNSNSNAASNGQPLNRRTDGLRGTPDRRNSGGSGGANNGSSGRNSSGQQQQGGYAAAAAKNSGQYSGRRQGSHEEYRDSNDWQMSKGKNGGGNASSSANDAAAGTSSFKHQQKVILEPKAGQRQSQEADKQGSRVNDLKNWNKDFPITYRNETAKSESKESTPVDAPPTTTSPEPRSNAWTRGPPSSLVAKAAAAANQTQPSTSNESAQKSVKAATQSQSSEKASTSAVNVPTTQEEVPTSSTETNNVEAASSEEQEQQEQPAANQSIEKSGVSDSASSEAGLNATDVSETSSTSKKKFEFNVNAPEFKPRTGPPSTAGSHAPMGVPPQQMQMQYGHQQMVAHQGQAPGHVAMQVQGAPIVSGVQMVPNALPVQAGMGPPLVVWSQQQPYSYSLMPGQPVQVVQQGVPLPRGPANQAQMYAANSAAAAAAAGGPQQNRRMFVQPQWQQMQMGQGQMANGAYYQGYQQGQVPAQQFSVATSGPHQAQMMGAPPPQAAGPAGGPAQGGYPQGGPHRGYSQQHQMNFMMQQQQQQQGGPQGQRYQQGPPPQQPQQQMGGAHEQYGAGQGQGQGQQGQPQSVPNSQPPTPGPQQQQHPQSVPSPAQHQQAGMAHGPGSGSNGSLAGSAAGSGSNSGGAQRSVSPASAIANQQQAGPPPQHQQGPPPQMMGPPQHVQFMHVAPHNVGQHPQMAHHQGPHQHHPQQQYYSQPVYYQPGMVYGHNMQMPAGPHGQIAGAQGMMGEGGQMEGGVPMMAAQAQTHFVDQFGNYVPTTSGAYYPQTHAPPPHAAGAMSRQNSLPHQQYQQAQQGQAGIGAGGPPPGMTPQAQTAAQ